MNLLLVGTGNETAVIGDYDYSISNVLRCVVKLCVNFPLLGVPNETVCGQSMVVDSLVKRGRDHRYYYCYYVIVVIMLCVLEYAVLSSVTGQLPNLTAMLVTL